jgi:chromosome segregation ATPase
MIERTSAVGDLRISPLAESSDPMNFESPLDSVRREVDSYFSTRAPEPRPALKLVGEVNPDVEALRNYLAMREQDVAVLNGQIRSSKERISQAEAELRMEKARNSELQELLSKAEQTIKGYDLEKRVEMEVVEKQIDDLDRQLKERTEKARVIETKLRLMSEEVNKVKDRVRVDIRRIRVREKELEGQLEILKKDSAALLQARDEKILELKRRVDLLEFNMELAQEQVEKERRSTDELRSKLRDAADAMKQANGYLEQ